MSLRSLQTRLNFVKIRPWRRLALRRVFLEAMQNIDARAKFYGVHGTISVAAPIFNNLKNTRRTKTLERLGLIVLLAGLGFMKGVTKKVLHFIRHGQESFLHPPTQISGLIVEALFMTDYIYIGIICNANSCVFPFMSRGPK